MLSNDISKRLMIRFKKSKDFYKTIEKLKQEGYVVLKNYDSYWSKLENKMKQVNVLRVKKDNNTLIAIFYEENEDTTSEYKQSILKILY